MTSGAAPEVVRLADPTALAQEAARRFADLSATAIADHGMFRVALSGGSTPKALFGVLAGETYAGSIDWEHIQVFFSDERFVPPDSQESNFHMANEVLLSRVPIPDRFVHRVPTVDVTPAESAALYEEGLRRVFKVGLGEVPRFDLILLGLGPDGHTASLFPGTDAVAVPERLVVENFVPKLDAWRITFTYPLINAGDVVMFLVQGSDKAQRVAEVMNGKGDLPASGVRPDPGRLIWLLDEAAGAGLSNSVGG